MPGDLTLELGTLGAEDRRFRAWWRSKVYLVVWLALFPIGIAMSLFRRSDVAHGSVVHIGELRHLFSRLVSVLKSHGIPATYVAVGLNPHWHECDVHLPPLANPVRAALRDFRAFWRHVARHEIVHLHCGIGVSPYLFELTFLKLMGRRIVVHFRGCEARVRETNMALHPENNICQSCDYAPNYLCMSRQSRRRRIAARRFADRILVTTPDLLDFWPEATHVPFLVPNLPRSRATAPVWSGDRGAPFRIVHVTNQPGIEGTSEIAAAVETLRGRGWTIDFTHVQGRPHDDVLSAYASAHLAIGKLKMGYYANAQVESMLLGVPTLTWIREDLWRPELERSGLIVATPGTLVAVLEEILENPERLADSRAQAAAAAERLHGEAVVVAALRQAYGLAG